MAKGRGHEALNGHLHLLHSADWHLDSSLRTLSPVLRAAVISAQQRFLAFLPEFAHAQEVDALLLAGDIFDRPNPDQTWTELFRQTCAAMSPLPIFIAPGNHDPYLFGGVWTDNVWPDNVLIFSPERKSVFLEALNLRIDGCAFSNFYCDETLRPAAAEPDGAACWKLLLTHGDMLPGGGASRYNPLSTGLDFIRTYHYVALGHVHQARSYAYPRVPSAASATSVSGFDSQAEGMARYPGPPQGRGFDECGALGVTICELFRDPLGRACVRSRHEEMMRLGFGRLTVEVTGLKTVDELTACVLAAATAEREGKHAESFAWSVILTGAKEASLPIAPDHLSARLQYLGLHCERVTDLTWPVIDIEKLARQPGLAGEICRQAKRGLPSVSKRISAYAPDEFEEALRLALSLATNPEASANGMRAELSSGRPTLPLTEAFLREVGDVD